MKGKKIIISLLIMCLIIPSTIICYASDVTLSVSAVSQSYSNWCWAACSEMSGKYYYNYKTSNTSYRSQTNVVVNEYGTIVNWGGTPQQVETGLEYVAYNSALCNAEDFSISATFSNVVGFIGLYKPIVAGIYSSNGNHAVLIHGYNNDNNNTEVIYINPASGNVFSSDYADFATDVLAGGSWDATIAWY